MMKVLCTDVDPKVKCDFVATGNTPKEVAQKMLPHLKTAHPDVVKKLNLSDDEMMKMIEYKAHE